MRHGGTQILQTGRLTLRPFTLDEQRRLVELCAKGVGELQAIQNSALGR